MEVSQRLDINSAIVGDLLNVQACLGHEVRGFDATAGNHSYNPTRSGPVSDIEHVFVRSPRLLGSSLAAAVSIGSRASGPFCHSFGEQGGL